MRGRKALLVAVPAVLAVATLALRVPISTPGLGREVEERVRTATGIPLEVSRARVFLLRGLVLEDVRFSAGTYRVRIARMRLEESPLDLLRGRWEWTGIHLEETEIDFAGGDLSIEALGMKLSRLEYDPRALTVVHGIGVEGVLSLGRVVLAGKEIRDLEAKVTAEGGRLRLEDLRLGTDRGDLSGRLALDFNTLPFRYRASVLGSSFELEGLGRGTLRLDAEGFGTKRRDLKGKGTFELEAGRLPDASWVREIDPSLAGAEHAPLEVHFEVRDDRVHFERFEIRTGDRLFELEGSIGLDGSWDLRAARRRRL